MVVAVGRGSRAEGPPILVSRLPPAHKLAANPCTSASLRCFGLACQLVELAASVRLGSSGRPTTWDDPRSESHFCRQLIFSAILAAKAAKIAEKIKLATRNSCFCGLRPQKQEFLLFFDFLLAAPAKNSKKSRFEQQSCSNLSLRLTKN